MGLEFLLGGRHRQSARSVRQVFHVTLRFAISLTGFLGPLLIIGWQLYKLYTLAYWQPITLNVIFAYFGYHIPHTHWPSIDRVIDSVCEAPTSGSILLATLMMLIVLRTYSKQD